MKGFVKSITFSLKKDLPSLGGDSFVSPCKIDGHGSHSNIRLPINELPDYPIPLFSLVVVHSVQVVWHRVDAVGELSHLNNTVKFYY